MFTKLREWFAKAWDWIQALWDKHDDHMEEMVQALLPMVIEVAFRNDLKGEEKRKVILDAVLDGSQELAEDVSTSMLNEAIEIAANKYNIQIGKLTISKIDAAREAALKAGRDFSNGKLRLSGTEAEDAGVKLDGGSEN